jgi:hypothetical protein
MGNGHRTFRSSSAQSGTFALPHIRHSNQSNAKEPAYPTHDQADKISVDKEQRKSTSPLTAFNTGTDYNSAKQGQRR